MRLSKGNVTAMCAVVALVVGSSDPSYGQCEGGLPDCNNNGVADECDIADGTSGDCNANGIPDECDITDSTSEDCNGDGRPDECGVIDVCEAVQLNVPGILGVGVSYLSFRYIASDGDIVVVGARANGCCGLAHVYRRRGSRLLLEQTLAPWDTQEQVGFGASVAVSGDVIIVGADLHRCTGSSLNCGAAYVFRHDGTMWVAQQILVPDVPVDGVRGFGFSIAAAGNRLVVGAPGGPAPSEVYVYRLDGDIWVEEQKLIGPPCSTLPLFGISVAISNDVILVGDTIDCSGATSASALSPAGFVYAYRFKGTGWFLEQALADGGYFGVSVAVDGDFAVIGASSGSIDQSLSGVAILQRFNGETWVEEGNLVASDPSTDAEFGGSVAYNGRDLIVVGAAGVDCAAGRKCGVAYLFRKIGDDWVETRKVTPSPRIDHGRFGASVVVFGNLVLVGESGADLVHVFVLEADDCNCNGSADVCEVAAGVSSDCNGTGVLDECELADGIGEDCDSDGVPDACQDCNGNGVGDGCDITDGISDDFNNNRIPDACEEPVMADPKDLYSSRVIAFVPQSEGFQTAIRVRLKKIYNTDPMDPDSAVCPPRSESLFDLSTLNGQVRWVGVPRSLPETSDSFVRDGNRFVGAELQCCPRFTDWPNVLAGMGQEVLHVYGPAIVPCSAYEVQIISSTCPDLDDESCYSQPLVVRTGKWGDVVEPLGGEGQPNFTDVGSVVDKFKGLLSPLKVQAMLRGNVLPLDGSVNFTDIGKAADAFRAIPYMEAGPSPCPSCS